MTKSHPYSEFENSKLWSVIEEAVSDLVDNNDLVEQTPRDYIVGYIVKKMNDAGYKS